MGIFAYIALLALFAACACGQSQTSAIASFAGRELILIKGGDQTKVKVKKSQVNRLKGSCDAAVVVKRADWKAGSVQFKLHGIGRPVVMNQRHGHCSRIQNEIVLEFSEFAPDEPVDSLVNSIRQVLQTPEEYLAYNGIPFSIPPGTEDQIPIKPSPPTHPTLLLSVSGNYSEEARAARLQGTVQLRLVVGADGRAHRVRLVRGLGLGLDENAIKVMPLWRFEPARQGEKAIAMESTIEMHFNLL